MICDTPGKEGVSEGKYAVGHGKGGMVYGGSCSIFSKKLSSTIVIEMPVHASIMS